MGAVPAAARAAWQQVRCCARIFACDSIPKSRGAIRAARREPSGSKHLRALPKVGFRHFGARKSCAAAGDDDGDGIAAALTTT